MSLVWSPEYALQLFFFFFSHKSYRSYRPSLQAESWLLSAPSTHFLSRSRYGTGIGGTRFLYRSSGHIRTIHPITSGHCVAFLVIPNKQRHPIITSFDLIVVSSLGIPDHANGASRFKILRLYIYQTSWFARKVHLPCWR